MKVTILITNYNYEKYLNRCIRSCLNQSMSKDNYEILIVDDCSTDDSYKILDYYYEKYNIRIIKNKKNIGLGASCRVGVMSALGKYIVRVDADDYVSKDFLKCLYLWASLNNSHAVCCDYYTVDFNENITGRFSQKESPIACGIMFRTDLIEYIGSYKKIRKNEEKDLMERFSDNFILEYLNLPLYRYMKHQGSLSGS